MGLTEASGGSLFMAEESDGEMYFRLKITAKEGDEPVFHPVTTRVIENSICGYVALTGKLLNISDLSSLKPMVLPHFNKTYDNDLGGAAVCLLTVPLKNSRHECVAVLQLVNKKRRTRYRGKRGPTLCTRR